MKKYEHTKIGPHGVVTLRGSTGYSKATLRTTGPVPAGLLAANTIGTQLRDPGNSGTDAMAVDGMDAFIVIVYIAESGRKKRNP